MSKRRAKGFTGRLGIVGWDTLDPVLLAALATRAPVLLIGAHGTAKTMVVERIAAALGQEFRHYNASLVNYDDLVGIPLPAESGDGLRFVGTRGAIWDAEFVLIDEISRCRADLQNKFFPIVHERRVAGLELVRLQHRWAAMNPPSPDVIDGAVSADPVYLGSEPLDPALCDRFHYVLSVPGWRELTKAQRRRLIEGRDATAEPGAWLSTLVTETERRIEELAAARPERLVDYVAQFVVELEKAGLPQSPRRARLIFAAVEAVHAAREALGGEAADLEESAHLAVRSALPQSATETPPAAAVVLAAHRQAWEISGLGRESTWRRVLEESDPVERVALGAELGVPEPELARLVTQALAAEPDDAGRIGLATTLFLAFRSTHTLTPAAWEPLARHARRVLAPGTHATSVAPGPGLEKWREIGLWSATWQDETGATAELARRFVLNGFPDLWTRTDFREAARRFRRDLERFGVPLALEREAR